MDLYRAEWPWLRRRFLAWLVLRNDEGNDTVREIAELIREGSAAFLRREYTILAIFVVAIFVVLLLFIDLNVLNESKIKEINAIGRVEQQGPWTALSYLAGAVGSALAGFIGMNIARPWKLQDRHSRTEGPEPGPAHRV